MKSYEKVKSQLASGGVADDFDEGDMQTLRQKTSEVAEIGQRIDEILRVNGDIEQQISRLGRCDEQLFAKLKSQSNADSHLKH